MQTSLCHKKLFNMGKRQGGSLVGGLWPPAGDNGALWDLSPADCGTSPPAGGTFCSTLFYLSPPWLQRDNGLGHSEGLVVRSRQRWWAQGWGWSRTRTSEGVPDQKSWCRIVSIENKGVSDVEEVGAEGWIGEWGPLGSQIDIGRHIQTAVREDWKVQHRQLLVEQ